MSRWLVSPTRFAGRWVSDHIGLKYGIPIGTYPLTGIIGKSVEGLPGDFTLRLLVIYICDLKELVVD